jgi:hypothetical protein
MDSSVERVECRYSRPKVNESREAEAPRPTPTWPVYRWVLTCFLLGFAPRHTQWPTGRPK